MESLLVPHSASLEQIRGALWKMEHNELNAIQVFRNYPITEIRREILRVMKNSWRIHFTEDAALAEETALWLKGVDDPLFHEFMEAYLFSASNPLAVRAIRFFLQHFPRRLENEKSKAIAGRMRFHPELYEEVNGYVDDELRAIHGYMDRSNHCSDPCWHRLERAIRIAVEAKDYSTLPALQLIMKQLRVINQPTPNEHTLDPFSKNAQTTFVETAMKILDKERRRVVRHSERSSST